MICQRARAAPAARQVGVPTVRAMPARPRS